MDLLGLTAECSSLHYHCVRAQQNRTSFTTVVFASVPNLIRVMGCTHFACFSANELRKHRWEELNSSQNSSEVPMTGYACKPDKAITALSHLVDSGFSYPVENVVPVSKAFSL